jgi:ABC-type Fe3+-hydroxamate transport system substrate-binding protein
MRELRDFAFSTDAAYNRRMSSHSPRRIACLQPSATVILASVGELGRVVACTKYCADVVPEVRDIKRLIIADSWTSKASEILAAKPDLVIAAVPYQEAAVIEILKAGIRFLGLAPRTLDDIYGDIALISSAVGKPASAVREVIAEMQAAIEDGAAADRIPSAENVCSAKNGASRSSPLSPGSRSW